MRRRLGILILLISGISSPLFAQRNTLFPQFVSGVDASDNVWICEMFFTNQDFIGVSGIVVAFYDFSGAPLSVGSNLGNATSYTFDLGPGATQAIQIDAEAGYVEGYAVISYPSNGSPVRATIVYRMEDDAGNVIAEFGIPQQEFGNHYSFAVEMNSSQRTSIALAAAYPAVFGSDPQDVIFNLIDTDGVPVAIAIVTLNPGEHFADYLFQSTLFETFFPDINNYDFIGSVSVSSPFGVGIMALRQDKNAFGAISTDGGPVLAPFAVSSPIIAEQEPNDDFPQAQPLAGSSLIDPADIGSQGDEDFYSFTGNTGDVVSVICDAQLAGSWLDSVLEIYDGSMNKVAENDQNGLSPELYPVNDSFIQVVLPANDTYYIKVRDFFGDGGPQFIYTLHVKITPAD